MEFLSPIYICVFAEGATDKHNLLSYDYIFRCLILDQQQIHVEEIVYAQRPTHWFPTCLQELKFLCMPPIPADSTNIYGHLETATLSYKNDSVLKSHGILKAPRICMETVDHLFAVPHSNELQFFGMCLKEPGRPGTWDFAAYVRRLGNTRYIIEKFIYACDLITDTVGYIEKGDSINIYLVQKDGSKYVGFAIQGSVIGSLFGTSDPKYTEMYAILEQSGPTPHFTETELSKNLRHLADAIEGGEPLHSELWEIQKSIEYLQSLVNGCI